MEQNMTRQVSNRQVKASAFTTFFSDPKNAAQLYSALDGVPVSPEDIQYTTLEGVLFMARKNDMAFTVRNRVLVISEHQSTVNANMPLRDVIYYGRTLEKLVEPKALYRNKLIRVPTPEFYVFYNGDEPFPSEKILRLSDSFIEKSTEYMLELLVKVININLPAGHTILKQCRPLYEYSWFIQKVKEHLQEGCERDVAITLAIQACEKAGIFEEFVREHGTEAVNMLFTQFNMEDALEVRYEEGFEDGEQQGIQQGLAKGMSLMLVEKVCRKLQKQKTAESIAEELDEPIETVKKICDAVHKCGKDADVSVVYETYQTMK